MAIINHPTLDFKNSWFAMYHISFIFVIAVMTCYERDVLSNPAWLKFNNAEIQFWHRIHVN